MKAFGILAVIAWRNLWRNTRRTLLTAGTISVGLGLLLVFLGIGDGSHQQMIQNAVRLGGAHVAVQTAGYQARGGIDLVLAPSFVDHVEGWASSRAGLITSILPRTFASGLASSADGSSGVRLVGLNPDRERAASLFDDRLVAGTFLGTKEKNVVVVGQGVARKLDLEPGDKLVLMAQSAGSSEIQSLLVRVAGIMRTGLDDIDQMTVLLPLGTSQELLGLQGGVHQIAITLRDSASCEKVVEGLRSALPGGVEVLGWDELMPELRDFIRIDDAGSYLFNTVFFLIIAFMVMNTLLMSVLERRREFALLDAVGLTPIRCFALVMLEATWIGLISTGAGLVLGYLGHLYLHVWGLPLDLFYSSEVSAAGSVIDPVLYSDLSFNRIAGASGLVFTLTVVLALLPAWRGATGADAHLLGQS